MKSSTLKLACLLASPLLTLSLGHAADTKLSSGDKTFVQKAAVSNMFEIETGKVAQEKGTSDEVKNFGSKMVEDHGKAGDEMKSLVSAKGLEVPAALDSKHQKMLDELNGKSGKAFDQAYLKEMKASHMEADSVMTKEAKSGEDPDLKAFAAKTDQVVKMHISMLKDMKSDTK